MKAAEILAHEQRPVTRADAALAEAVDLLAGRLASGQSLDLEAFLAEHAACAEQLRALLPSIQAMAALGASLPLPRPGEPTSLGAAGMLGDFEIGRELGRGGMGVVYEARQLSLGRRVALKVLRFAAVLDERQLARFKNEAMAAAVLEHPHIVPVYSVGCERGVHFYAMRYIDGTTLAEAFLDRPGCPEGQSAAVLDRGRPSASAFSPGESGCDANGMASGSGTDACRSLLGPPHRSAMAPDEKEGASHSPLADTQPVAQLPTQIGPSTPAWWRRLAVCGIQAAEALDHAHEQGIIHRDVKPSNLLLDVRGHLWVADFGLAQVAGNHELTLSGDLPGTLRYMSPEQARGERILDQRTDVYSLGATLYELLTQRPAFPATDRQQLFRQISSEEPPAPCQLDRRIPKDLETIVLKAMAKEPAERYLTAGQLADDLRRFVDRRPILARPASAWSKALRLARRQRVPLLATVAAMILVLSASVVLLWRGQQETAGALAREKRQRTVAQQNLRLALQALKNLYGEFVGEHLGQRPDLNELQRKLMLDSLRFYQIIALNSRTSSDSLPEAAEAFHVMGELHRKFGPPESAEDAYRQSISLYRQLTHREPGVGDHALGMAKTQALLGHVLFDLGRASEAESLFRESAGQYRALRLRLGRGLAAADAEEASFCILASVLEKLDRLDEAEAVYADLNRLLREQLQANPNDAQTRHHLAQHLRHQAAWQLERGNAAGARELLNAGVQEEQRAADDAPPHLDLRLPLLQFYEAQEECLRALGDTAAAEKASTAARSLSAGFGPPSPDSQPPSE